MKAMEVFKCLLFFIVLIIASLLTAVVEGNKYEILLLDSIFKGYDKRTRPVEDHHSPIIVNFSVSVQQILQVDEKHQTITTNIWRHMFWNDCYLKWNPENYGNITEFSLLPGQIWLPDIRLYNLASYDKFENSVNALFNNGLVVDVLPMAVKSTCKIDVTWFPFDEQKCSLIFGSWTSHTKYLRIETIEHEDLTSTSRFVDNGEWELLGVTTVTTNRTYNCCGINSYMNVSYIIHLKRRPLYYFFNLLIPCALIGFLALLGFTLPPESGEKLSVGCTILFSLIVFLNTIGQSMPANSDTVPLLGTYFNCVMITIALSVVSTIVINLNLNGVSTREISGHSKTIFFHWLPWILCMNPPPPNLVSRQHDQRPSCKKKVKVSDVTSLGVNRSQQMDSMVSGNSLDEKAIQRQQWIYIANVVERFCLIIALLFTFVSVVVFLIYAF